MSADDDHQTYDQLLTATVTALTAAARLSWTTTTPDGSTHARPCDWAEFVTRALAGAAANVGGIEEVLAGRPGSWEAAGVGSLLSSTVGEDEQHLLEHRTEPLTVEVFVDEIMVDLGVWKAYDDAQAELGRRYDAIGIPTASTPEAAAQLPTATDDQEKQADAIGDLEARLEAQRVQDWTQYGQALKTHIEATAGQLPGLNVPVVVQIDLDTFRADGGDRSEGLTGRLLLDAIDNTPLPGTDRPPRDAGPALTGDSVLARLTESTPPAVPSDTDQTQDPA